MHEQEKQDLKQEVRQDDSLGWERLQIDCSSVDWEAYTKSTNNWSSRHYNAHLKEAHKADEWLDHGVDFFKLARAFEGRDEVATSKWLILKKYIIKQETQWVNCVYIFD